MGKPSSQNRKICMVLYYALCMLILGVIVSYYEGWTDALAVLALFGLIGYLSKAYQLYYCRTVIQIIRVLISFGCTWFALYGLLNRPFVVFGNSVVLLVIITLLIRRISSRIIVPATTVIIYDTEQNVERARKLALEDNNSMRVMCEFGLSKNDTKELIDYINTFHIQQLCVFVEDEQEMESLLKLCSDKEMAVVVGAPVSNSVKKRFSLNRMSYFNHVYFSTDTL